MKRSPHPVSWATRLAVVAFVMVFTMLIYGQGDGDPAVITAQSSTPTPIRGFAFPVVPNAPISGHFDHKQTTSWAAGWIQFYDGRANPSATSGYTFSCPALNAATDWVSCENAVQGEPSCPNHRELWYDQHSGIDFEYFPDWHTGATCDRNKFENRTWHWPIFSASNGQVNLVEWSKHNGRAYRVLHDHNGDGNASNDGTSHISL
jgi:hypothetical protein